MIKQPSSSGGIYKGIVFFFFKQNYILQQKFLTHLLCLIFLGTTIPIQRDASVDNEEPAREDGSEKGLKGVLKVSGNKKKKQKSK